MAGTLARRFAFRYWKADRDPVGIFAHDVAAIDDIDGKYLVGPVAYAGLKPGPDHARNIGRAGLTKCLDRPLQHVGELPVEANAIEQVMPISRAVPQPAAVEVDPHGFGKPVGCRDDRE
jgi:hypothetical protein